MNVSINKLFPEIPSFLELEILNFSGFCPICESCVSHNLTTCKDCDSNLCLDYPGGIWKMQSNQPQSGCIKNYICFLS